MRQRPNENKISDGYRERACFHFILHNSSLSPLSTAGSRSLHRLVRLHILDTTRTPPEQLFRGKNRSSRKLSSQRELFPIGSRSHGHWRGEQRSSMSRAGC